MSVGTRSQRYLAYALGGYGLSMNGLAYFLVPLRANELGASIAVIGLLLGVKALTETVLSVPLGAFIDRVGPRSAFLIGCVGTVLVGLGLMGTSSVVILFMLQFGLGTVRPLGWVGGQSYVSSMRSGAERNYDTGKFSFSANVGQIVAPLMAGALASAFGTRLAFAAMVLYGVVFFAVMLALPAASGRRAPGESGTSFGAFLQLSRLRDIQVAMLLTFTRLWITAVWIPFYPLYLVSTGTSTALAGSVVSSMAVAATMTSLFAGRIGSLGGGPASVTAAGLAVGCSGVALSPVLDGVPWFYLAAALVGVGQGLSLPMLISIVSSAAPPGQRSLALGLRSSVNQAAAAAAPVVIAPIIGLTGLTVGFGIAAILGGAPLLAALAVAHRASRSSAPRQPGAL